jgi:hypothetical protein
MQKLHNQPYEQFNQIDGVFMSPTFATTLEKELYEALKASQQIQSLTMQAAAADRAGKDFYAERCREDIHKINSQVKTAIAAVESKSIKAA